MAEAQADSFDSYCHADGRGAGDPDCTWGGSVSTDSLGPGGLSIIFLDEKTPNLRLLS